MNKSKSGRETGRAALVAPLLAVALASGTLAAPVVNSFPEDARHGGPAGQGAAPAALTLDPRSRLWLEGDSTLHAYSSTATVLELSGTAESEEPGGWARVGEIKGFELSIPVKGLASGKAGLDSNMRSALRAAEHPRIVFRMSGRELRAAAGGPGRARVVANGTLSVAGREKDLEVEADLDAGSSTVRVAGSRELRMTDFGIKPPSLFLGALKTDDRVVVHFDLSLSLRDAAGAGSGSKQP